MSAPAPYKLEIGSYYKVDSPSSAYAANRKSQSGEDGIIEQIFAVLPDVEKYCVEFGAWDGKHLSNSYDLIATKGWRGCLIEGEPERFDNLVQTHGGRSGVSCVNTFVDFEGSDVLDNILASVNAPQNLGLLSIDVDGTDYFIWESLKNYQPSLVVIEFNPAVPIDVLFVQAKSSGVSQGCSLPALVLLGKAKGYELVCCTFTNGFFVKAQHLRLFNIPNNAPPFMYKPKDLRIFYGFDSTIITVGYLHMLWRDFTIAPELFEIHPDDRDKMFQTPGPVG